MTISSRTPEGLPHRCVLCGKSIVIEPSVPPGDAPCPRCGHLLWFDAERRSDEVVIQFREGVRSVEMVHLLKRALAKLGASRIVLDFHGFDHLSSKALGKLINLRKKMESSPVRLSIRNIHPDLLEVFKITRLDQMFPIEDV